MTTTNQAFIRVYRQDPAELGPEGPIIAHAGRHTHAALRASVEIVAATGSRASRAGETALFGTSIDVLPPRAEPAAAVPLSSRARQREKNFIPPQTGAPARRLGQANPPKKPLSSFIARQRAAQAPTTQDHAHDLRPGTTVASFRWPAVCRALLQHSTAAFDDLADRIQPPSTSAPTVVGMLSLFRGNGCTTMALCLAARLARRSRRVILVDGSFASPQLAPLLDVVPTVGWQESLASGAPAGDSIVRSMDDRLDLLALSRVTRSDPQELVARPQSARLAEQLRRGYELVLVDLGTFFDPQSQPVALELITQWRVDAVLAVTGEEEADSRDLETLAKHLERRGCQLAGITENRRAG
jgi:Mrp family chromosome partitioning ATPase